MTTEAAGSAGGADDLDLFEAEATGQAASTSSTIPDKYTGKTVDDLIKMHQNAEKVISRQGQEVSQIRRLSDEILNLKKPTTQATEERKPVTVEALLNDPEKAIRDAVANSDVGKRAENAEARVVALEAGITERDFVSKHKEFAADINDPAFTTWVNKNPLRQALANRTAQKDFTAATNLWDLWEEHKEIIGGKPGTQVAGGDKRTVPSTVKASPSENLRGKPTYSRAKLMELRMKVQAGHPASLARWNDPHFQEKLNNAYAENRVK